MEINRLQRKNIRWLMEVVTFLLILVGICFMGEIPGAENGRTSMILNVPLARIFRNRLKKRAAQNQKKEITKLKTPGKSKKQKATPKSKKRKTTSKSKNQKTASKKAKTTSRPSKTTHQKNKPTTAKSPVAKRPVAKKTSRPAPARKSPKKPTRVTSSPQNLHNASATIQMQQHLQRPYSRLGESQESRDKSLEEAMRFSLSENPLSGQEQILANPAQATTKVPAGYVRCDVPGDGRCGYWSILVAVAAKHAVEIEEGLTEIQMEEGGEVVCRIAKVGGDVRIEILRKAVSEFLDYLVEKIMASLDEIGATWEELVKQNNDFDTANENLKRALERKGISREEFSRMSRNELSEMFPDLDILDFQKTPAGEFFSGMSVLMSTSNIDPGETDALQQLCEKIKRGEIWLDDSLIPFLNSSNFTIGVVKDAAISVLPTSRNAVWIHHLGSGNGGHYNAYVPKSIKEVTCGTQSFTPEK